MLNRIQPLGTPEMYKSYTLRRPLGERFWRDVSCEEARCPAQANGWRSLIDERTAFGRQQSHYIRKMSGRRFAEELQSTGLTAFIFEPGQRCFGGHKAPIERDPLCIVQGGDWRGNPRGEVRRHARPADWVEDFSEHQDRIGAALGRG
jgi:hypothetical protein